MPTLGCGAGPPLPGQPLHAFHGSNRSGCHLKRSKRLRRRRRSMKKGDFLDPKLLPSAFRPLPSFKPPFWARKSRPSRKTPSGSTASRPRSCSSALPTRSSSLLAYGNRMKSARKPFKIRLRGPPELHHLILRVPELLIRHVEATPPAPPGRLVRM